MRDSRRIQERVQVRVDRARIVWLTLGLVVSLALTFAFGFIVGRRAARIEPAPPATDVISQIESDKQMHEELTFYKTLNEKQAKLEQRDHRPRTPAPAVARPTPPEAVAVAPAAPQPKAKKKKQETLEKAVARARKVARKTDPKKVEKALSAGPAQPGDYTVQVSAFQSLGEAKAYSSGLERKGFRPFVVTTMIQGRGTWYRVRLGRFDSEHQAEEAKTMLAQAAIPAWVLLVE